MSHEGRSNQSTQSHLGSHSESCLGQIQIHLDLLGELCLGVSEEEHLVLGTQLLCECAHGEEVCHTDADDTVHTVLLDALSIEDIRGAVCVLAYGGELPGSRWEAQSETTNEEHRGRLSTVEI